MKAKAETFMPMTDKIAEQFQCIPDDTTELRKCIQQIDDIQSGAGCWISTRECECECECDGM
jgi:hypothetical protein